jgi:hypothetical protein
VLDPVIVKTSPAIDVVIPLAPTTLNESVAELAVVDPESAVKVAQRS